MSTYPPPPPQGGGFPGSVPAPPPAYPPPPPAPPGNYQPAYGAQAAPPPKKTNWIPWVAGGCGCLVLVIAAFGFFIFMGVKAATAGAEKVVQDFLEAGGNENWEAAYGYFSAPLKETQSYDEFLAASSQNAHFFKIKETTFTERSVDTTTAKLGGSVTLAAGTSVPAKFQLVKENGEWRLISYSIGNFDE